MEEPDWFGFLREFQNWGLFWNVEEQFRLAHALDSTRNRSFYSNERALRGCIETNQGCLGLSRIIPTCWYWQKKNANQASLLAEFLFLPCPIRAANAPVLISAYPCSSVIGGFLLFAEA